MDLIQWFHDRFSPLFNVDGTPMVNSCIDVLGNPYGITQSDHDASLDLSASHDSWQADSWSPIGTDTP